MPSIVLSGVFPGATGGVARYALSLLEAGWQDPDTVDRVVSELPGAWHTPKAAGICVSDYADAICIPAA